MIKLSPNKKRHCCYKDHTPHEILLKYIEKTWSCWLWKGNLNTGGYGYFTKDAKIYYCHRLSYEIHKGPIPKGLCICHSCDNRSCVNPDHLWIGTVRQNVHDAIKKKRFTGFINGKGLNHSQCKLTIEQVQEIRDMRKKGISGYKIAEKFNLCNQHVYDIANRKFWKDI